MDGAYSLSYTVIAIRHDVTSCRAVGGDLAQGVMNKAQAQINGTLKHCTQDKQSACLQH